MARVAKIVERKPKGIASAYKYPIWCMRVVECEPGQGGNLNERGVVLWWQSENYTSKGQKPGCSYQKILAEAKRVCDAANQRLALGLAVETPDEVLHDFLEEKSNA